MSHRISAFTVSPHHRVSASPRLRVSVLRGHYWTITCSVCDSANELARQFLQTFKTIFDRVNDYAHGTPDEQRAG